MSARVATLLVTAAVLAALGLAALRISRIEGAFSANDRSRWASVRALVDNDTFVVGSRQQTPEGFVDTGIIAEPGWGSVDVVMDPQTLLFYSSKPPFLAYVVSWPVRLLAHLGHPLTSDRPLVTRIVLVLFCWLPLLVAILAVLQMVRARSGTAAQVLIVVTLGAGSFLAPFVVTLNNHVPAAGAAALALAAFARAWEKRSMVATMVAGVASATAFALEPPAAALFGALAMCLFVRSPGRALVFFMLPATAVLMVHFAMTWLVFGTPFFFFGPSDTWYEFAGSYWLARGGIEVDDASIGHYLLHFLVGHHGLFSLTPLVALGIAGLVADAGVGWRRALVWMATALLAFAAARYAFQHLKAPTFVVLAPAMAVAVVPLWTKGFFQQDTRPLVARLALAIIMATIGFYAVIVRGYGGVTIGPRWFIWIVPLWALGLPAVVASIGTRSAGRALLLLATALSIWFATPPGINPWVDPKLYTPGVPPP